MLLLTVYKDSLFSISSPTSMTCWLYDDSYSERCEVTSHQSLGVHFSDDLWYWASFYVPVGHLYTFLRKNIHSSLLPTFWLFAFLYRVIFICIHIWLLTPYQLQHLQIFSLFQLIVFHFVDAFLCCASFKFNQVSFVFFCFFFFCLSRHIWKQISMIYVKECSAYVLF